MKYFSTILALGGFFSTATAKPVADTSVVEVRGGSTNIVDIWASVDAHITAVLDICAAADVNIDSALDVRAEVAATLKADLDACAEILADAAVAIKAEAKVDVVAANDGCDSKCIERTTVDHTKKFCGAVDKVVKQLGKDCTKTYIKPAMSSFGDFTLCLDGVFVGLGAKIGAAVDAVLGVALSLDLGLSLDLDILLGGIIGIGRV